MIQESREMSFYDVLDVRKNAPPESIREAYVRATAAYVDRWVNNLKSGVATARIVDLPRAGHFVFLSREDDVISGIRKQGSSGARPSMGTVMKNS